VTLARLAEGVPCVLYEYLPPRRGKDRFSWVSAHARELLEVDPAELVRDSQLLWAMIPEEDRVRLANTVHEAVRTRGAIRAEFPIVTRSGRQKWLHVWCNPEPSTGRRHAPRWSGVFVDVSDAHRRLDAANRERALFQRVSEGSPDIVLRFGRDGRVQYANPALAAAGLAPERALGKTAEDLGLPVDSVPAWRQALERAFQGEVARVDVRGVRGEREYEVIVVPERAPADGEVESVISVGRDVTERSRALQDLRESDRRKSDFLAMLSHELRNPLAPIRNALYLLRRAAPGSDQAERAFAVLERQVGQLARLVDDLLDVTRIERNRIHLERRRLELNELVLRTAEDHRSTFEAAGIELSVEPAEEALYAEGDAARLAQVIANLLQNAAKFTERGGATRVRVRRGPAPWASVLVQDTGIGMTPETLSRLFQPFRQEEAGRVRGGLGLGLALVKGLVASHGGEVEARSPGPGLGSELEVRLPLVEDERRGAAHRRGARPRRILVIEDNVDFATTLRELLELEGHEVEIAHEGAEGLARARERPPEIVLCDLGLPGMDGFAVARAFRSVPELKDVHLVAVSGYALPDDVRRAAEAGFERHLPKPASLEVIEQALDGIP
jgi:two-component system CheB/CheR fusion protein